MWFTVTCRRFGLDQFSCRLPSCSTPANVTLVIHYLIIGSGWQAVSNVQTQLLLHDEQDSYLQQRADAMQSIESTIVELGGIFQQLAHMVKEQVRGQ